MEDIKPIKKRGRPTLPGKMCISCKNKKPEEAFDLNKRGNRKATCGPCLLKNKQKYLEMKEALVLARQLIKQRE